MWGSLVYVFDDVEGVILEQDHYHMYAVGTEVTNGMEHPSLDLLVVVLQMVVHVLVDIRHTLKNLKRSLIRSTKNIREEFENRTNVLLLFYTLCSIHHVRDYRFFVNEVVDMELQGCHFECPNQKINKLFFWLFLPQPHFKVIEDGHCLAVRQLGLFSQIGPKYIRGILPTDTRLLQCF